MIRTISGGLFVILFNIVIYAGHLHTVMFILLLQFGCFREMVSGTSRELLAHVATVAHCQPICKTIIFGYLSLRFELDLIPCMSASCQDSLRFNGLGSAQLSGWSTAAFLDLSPPPRNLRHFLRSWRLQLITKSSSLS